MLKNLQECAIDYELLSTACKFYTSLGYRQIEVPWLVNEWAALTPTPDGTRGCAFVTDDGEYLLCSAEQGFVQMMREGRLTAAENYFSVSPCFRNETMDATHSRTFLKLELFAYFPLEQKMDASIRSVDFMENARELFIDRMAVPTKMAPTDIGFDLIDDNCLELGSYGFRKSEDFCWAYGTGLALPRISIAKKGPLRFYCPYPEQEV